MDRNQRDGNKRATKKQEKLKHKINQFIDFVTSIRFGRTLKLKKVIKFQMKKKP